MFKRISRVLAASTLLAGSVLGAAQAAEQEINFGIISTESSQNLKAMWDPFLADMGKQTGTKINAFFAPDYAGIIQGMRFDKVDIAWYGNKSAMEAVDRAGGEVAGRFQLSQPRPDARAGGPGAAWWRQRLPQPHAASDVLADQPGRARRIRGAKISQRLG